MTNQSTPKITPPLELVRRLCTNALAFNVNGMPRADIEVWLIQEAYAAGANEETLEYTALED
jgi:hypothetical protein